MQDECDNAVASKSFSLHLLFLLFVIVTKRNMTTSKISTIAIATTPPDRAAVFHAPVIASPMGQYTAYRQALRHKNELTVTLQ